MDLDAVLARRPTIALVDELAHTNAPGSRNPKRYQDVEELLRAGISVITTLNIQHLESLHDIVERATGVRVKERLPDYVVTMADQIVNVDLSAEDLRERLQAGKIYPAERIQTAMENFFTPEKLTQLRELAMEEIAFRLDRRRREEEQRSGETASGSERVMVCLSSRSPHAAAPAAQGGPDRRPPGRPLVRGLRADAARSRPSTSTPPRSARSATTSTWPGSWAARRWPSRARPGQHDRRLRQGIRHHAHRPGPQPAALVSPLVRPVGPRPPAANDSRRGRDGGRYDGVEAVGVSPSQGSGAGCGATALQPTAKRLSNTARGWPQPATRETAPASPSFRPQRGRVDYGTLSGFPSRLLDPRNPR